MTDFAFAGNMEGLGASGLFWVALAISGLVVAIFGVVGIRYDTVTVLNWETPVHFVYLSLITPATFYKLLFVNLGVSYWPSDAVELFGGVGFASAATPDATLDPMMPDADSVRFALGVILAMHFARIAAR